jgi:hypothetical protein
MLNNKSDWTITNAADRAFVMDGSNKPEPVSPDSWLNIKSTLGGLQANEQTARGNAPSSEPRSDTFATVQDNLDSSDDDVPLRNILAGRQS